jgi:hypothetical protein
VSHPTTSLDIGTIPSPFHPFYKSLPEVNTSLSPGQFMQQNFLEANAFLPHLWLLLKKNPKTIANPHELMIPSKKNVASPIADDLSFLLAPTTAIF